MDMLIGGLPLWAFAAACGVTLMAGTVKGAIGFALPLIMIATLPSFMPPQLALAAVILPVLVTNLHQALRQGWVEAKATARRFWRLIAATALMIALSAPLAVILSEQVLVLLLGSAVLAFSLMQASGWRPEIPAHRRPLAEVVTGLVGGFYGGIAAVWGPPLIVYLLAARVEKREMVRVLSVVFTLGAVVLLVSHIATGVLNRSTAVLSGLLLIPAMTGMWIGYRIQERLDPELFRKLTLIMLSLGALNLLRRGLMG
jgi:uncharacterized protein